MVFKVLKFLSLDEMRIGYVKGPRFGERLSKFAEQGVFHGLHMKLLLPCMFKVNPRIFTSVLPRPVR